MRAVCAHLLRLWGCDLHPVCPRGVSAQSVGPWGARAGVGAWQSGEQVHAALPGACGARRSAPPSRALLQRLWSFLKEIRTLQLPSPLVWSSVPNSLMFGSFRPPLGTDSGARSSAGMEQERVAR